MTDLTKIDPQFRLLTDQLFFTDRTDLDLSNYATLLEAEPEHYRYLWDRLIRSLEISWPESFWLNRFGILFDAPIGKKNKEEIETFLLNNFARLITHNYGADPKFNNEYVQFIAWNKIKAERKESVTNVREYLLGLSHILHASRIANVIEHFIPYLFRDMAEYIILFSKRIGQSARNFEVLRALEAQGIPVDKTSVFKLAKNLLFKRVPNRPNRRSFFAMLTDNSVMDYLKLEYKAEYRDKLVDFIKACDYKEIEEYHLRNVKNLLELDSSIADELMTTYADRLYARGTGHKGANVKRLIRLCKTYPQFSPKKVLVYLSSNNRMSDIKPMVSAFPDLKALVPFV